MSMHVELFPEKEYLRVKVSGEFSLEEAQRTFLEILDGVVRFQAKKVLVDGRELTGSPELIDRFCYGKFTAESVWASMERGVSPATQFAYVLLEPILDPNRFGETVAVNRGLITGTFDNVKDACDWLEIAPLEG